MYVCVGEGGRGYCDDSLSAVSLQTFPHCFEKKNTPWDSPLPRRVLPWIFPPPRRNPFCIFPHLKNFPLTILLVEDLSSKRSSPGGIFPGRVPLTRTPHGERFPQWISSLRKAFLNEKLVSGCINIDMILAITQGSEDIYFPLSDQSSASEH